MVDAKAKIVSRILISETGCWEWTGYIEKNGYGKITFRRKRQSVHRLSYSSFKGDIPEGMDVCHRCDVRHCVNPEHLFVGTRKQNMEDCVNKGRQAKGDKLQHLVGEKCNFSKLCSDDVIQIRKLKSEGVKTSEIAFKFNVSGDNIRRIVRRDTWSHI